MKRLSFWVKYVFIMAIIGFIALLGIYIYAYFTPAIALNAANSYYIYDNKGDIIYQGSSNSEWVSLQDIDPDFLTYIINVEDQYFYYHKGFDILRIIKTLFLNFTHGKIIAGASSISQQYVKNLFLTFDQTWERKVEEAFLTIRLETHYSKDEILEGYLNTINFGQGIYGIKDAAQYYFNKDIKDISPEEAIVLAGIPKSPNNYNPIANFSACMKRSKLVAQVLHDNKVLSDEEYNNLKLEEITLYGKHQNNNLDTLMYYQDAVIEELYQLKAIPKSLIKAGGLRIYTNLNLETQRKMEESVKENALDDQTQLSAIVVDPPTGKVLALMGGRNYALSQYNRAIQAKRQVGSTIKPFLYYAALNNGMTTASTFKSEKTTFVFSENKTYAPTNYGNTYGNRDITMNAALSYSDNIYAVKTHLFLGEETLVNTLKSAGLKEKLAPNPSLALGASEINMLDYATAYATLANQGIKNELYFISRVEDMYGNLLYEHKDKPVEALDKSIAYIVSEMMRTTYDYSYVDYYTPTVIYLNGKISKKYALKSGTTDNDYWLAGFNSKVLMLVWAGNDDNSTVAKSYSKIIKNIWCDTVEDYLKDEKAENTWYEKPENVIALPMDPISGKYNPQSKSLFYFINGTHLAYLN